MRALLAALLLALPPLAAPAPSDGVTALEVAEVYVTSSAAIPGNDAAWAPVRLPHAWFFDPAMSGGWVWYRIRFDQAAIPTAPQRLFMSRSVVFDQIVYFNREPVWRHLDVAAQGAQVQPVLIHVPMRLIRTGENVIHLRVRGHAPSAHGVARLHFGDGRELLRRAALANFAQSQMIGIVAFAFGLAGLLSLALWMGERRDPVFFWYGLTGVGLLVATAIWQIMLLTPDLGAWRVGLVFYRFSGFLTPLFILHLRLAGRRHPWLEGVLWCLLIAACASVGVRHAWTAQMFAFWGLVYAVLPLAFLGVLFTRGVERTAAIWLLMLADLVASGFVLHDWAVRTGLLDFDRFLLAYYVAPFIMLAAGATIFKRHLEGVRALRRSNVDLEQHVQRKAAEIEANHARMHEAERVQALAEERKRIMADMHDGLGSRLVGLLSLAQSGRADANELKDGIAAALDELRLAIDSLEPVEGDIGVVLGNVRHRMRSVFERAGVRFVWNVGELPRLDDLTPSRIQAIQRVLLEVFTNAIKHADARTVTVSTSRSSGEVRITIEDDGRGFDAAAAGGNGRGLQNLRVRAAQAGGTVLVDSSAQAGTRVALVLPYSGSDPPVQAADKSRDGPTTSVVPGSGYLPDSGDTPDSAPRLA